MSRLPKVRIHELEVLPEKIQALLALAECEATWSFTTGAWLVYERVTAEQRRYPKHPLWRGRYEVIFGQQSDRKFSIRTRDQWGVWVAAIQRIKRACPDDCATPVDAGALCLPPELLGQHDPRAVQDSQCPLNDADRPMAELAATERER